MSTATVASADSVALPAALTLQQARATLATLTAAVAARPEPVFDASALTELDTSALAVLLECQRQAARLGRRLQVRHAPDKLVKLAQLYGVEALLGLKPEGG